MSLSDMVDMDDLKKCVACHGYHPSAEFHPTHTDMCKRCGDRRDEVIGEEKPNALAPPPPVTDESR
jgi:hypothetical protein